VRRASLTVGPACGDWAAALARSGELCLPVDFEAAHRDARKRRRL